MYKDIRYIEPLVKRCIPLPQKLYNITRRLGNVEEVEKYFPEFKSIYRRNRPGDSKAKRQE